MASEAPSAFSQSATDTASGSLARLRQRRAEATEHAAAAAAASAAEKATKVKVEAKTQQALPRSMWHVYVAYQLFQQQQQELGVRCPGFIFVVVVFCFCLVA